MVALFGREVQGGRFVAKQAAYEPLTVLDDPAAATVAADDEAGRSRRKRAVSRAALDMLCVCHFFFLLDLFG
jgi:hypothetical protein